MHCMPAGRSYWDRRRGGLHCDRGRADCGVVGAVVSRRMNKGVRATSEVARILALPRRDPNAPQLTGELTNLLRTPRGRMQLRPVQALALHDAGVYGGAFCPIGVGEGKTLITLLAPYVLEAQRPLLLLPAGLVEKTERERRQLSAHWLIPSNLRLLSYEMLGRAQSALELEVYKPDAIICDEVHRLKNRRAAVTRRVARWMQAHPETRFIALSGTIMRKSLLEFGHILRWCLKDRAPIPKSDHELEEWASALDEDTDELRRLDPGVLRSFCDSSVSSLSDVRRGFRRRLVETPGVVASAGDGERVDCSIYVRAITYKLQPITNRHFEKLRGAWLTPDDWPLCQGVDVWRHARELALGFHYVWDPRPPKRWMDARRDWAAFVREVLSRSRTLDSELQVAQACATGKLADDKLRAWQSVRDTFTPHTVAVWHDDSVLDLCTEWMSRPGLVWTEHALFAERLSAETGIPYFGAKGLTSSGRFIDDADSKRAAILSIDANREGRNLQTKWSRNLVVSPPEGADVWQQNDRPNTPAGTGRRRGDGRHPLGMCRARQRVAQGDGGSNLDSRHRRRRRPEAPSRRHGHPLGCRRGATHRPALAWDEPG